MFHCSGPLRADGFMLAIVAFVGLACPLSGQVGSLTADQELARSIFEQLIEINTTPSGSTTEAADAMAARLLEAGFPSEDIHVVGPHPRRGNLVVRLRGDGSRQPILLLAHLDVVTALPEDWSVDPFKFLEDDGYYYGRGTTDDKAMAAIWIANLIRLRREGFTPNRDIIVALTADEEGGDNNGVVWLLANHREFIEAEYVLNEGGGGQLKDGRHLLNEVQASEKVYLSFQLEVTNPGGHSSLPTRDNAIYHLAQGLARLAAFDFPVVLNEVTRGFFARMSEIETGRDAADMRGVLADPPDEGAVMRLSDSPYYNALLRTTCVATQLAAGHAENALPQTARATVNCRILPGESPADVQLTLTRVLDDQAITLTPMGEAVPSPPSPLTEELLGVTQDVTSELWPGTPVVPTMVTGATDGLYLRNAGIPVYGVSGLFEEMDDIRAHGKDERISVTSFFDGHEFLNRLVRALSSRPAS